MPRLCAANATCCYASRSRFASFKASCLCAFWLCYLVCGCDCDAPVVAVAVPVGPPAPSNAALLGSVKTEIFQFHRLGKYASLKEALSQQEAAQKSLQAQLN